MTQLTRTLEGALDAATQQGGGLSAQTVSALRVYRRQMTIASAAILVAALAAFILVLVASARYLDNADQLKGIAGGLGLSMSGALIALRGTWKDWSQANLLLVMVEDASDAQIERLLTALIKKL